MADQSDIQALAGLAASTDAQTAEISPPPVDPNAPPAPPEPPGWLEQANDVMNGLAGLAIGYAPEAADVLTDDARAKCAMVIAPLMEKYNLSMIALPPELIALVVAGPVLYRTAVIVADKIKADRAAKADAKRLAAGAAAAPAPKVEAPVQAVHPQTALYP